MQFDPSSVDVCFSLFEPNVSYHGEKKKKKKEGKREKKEDGSRRGPGRV